MSRVKAAIIGSGNIGTDLMVKMLRGSEHMELAAVVGIDAASEGLAMARARGVATTHEGIEGLRKLACYGEIGIAFDATSAYAHKVHDAALRADGIQVVDLTPAAIGPFVRLFDASFTLEDVKKAELSLRIEGEDGFVLEGTSNMARISRSPEALVSATIGDHHQYPDGLVLMLGTMFAPTMDRDGPGKGFTHKLNDIVEISTPLLENPPPVRLYDQGGWGPKSIHQLIAPHAWRLPFERAWRNPIKD